VAEDRSLEHFAAPTFPCVKKPHVKKTDSQSRAQQHCGYCG
jgi:hypothetical protein